MFLPGINSDIKESVLYSRGGWAGVPTFGIRILGSSILLLIIIALLVFLAGACTAKPQKQPVSFNPVNVAATTNETLSQDSQTATPLTPEQLKKMRQFHANPNVPPAADPKIRKLEEKWGIRIVGIMPASGGHMLDFRFKVIDPEKAAPLLARRAHPYLMDEKTGVKCVVPVSGKVGALRQDVMRPTPNRIYYSFFANPGKLVKSGDQVSIVIDNFKAEHLIVQ